MSSAGQTVESYSSSVKIIERFQKAIQLEKDLESPSSLDGFVPSRTVFSSLDYMLQVRRESEQAAFTWTGPFGSGKSSFALLVAALLGQSSVKQEKASLLLGDTATEFREAFCDRGDGFKILAVVGSRTSAAQAIYDCAVSKGLISAQADVSDKAVAEAIFNAVTLDGAAPVVLIVDEMGKFLEHEAQANGDIFIFQLLAELASRSAGKLILVGILHQAIDQYGAALSRSLQDEWSKIQGRFSDVAISPPGEEQLELIAQAINGKGPPDDSDASFSLVAEMLGKNRPLDEAALEAQLRQSFPLHPSVACLLGPLSRRRFGQNQRSIFGFLNSTERGGFRDFLSQASYPELYTPEDFWEYLRSNLDAAITSSSDGHRWAVAIEGVDRCEGTGGTHEHLAVLKTVAVIDLFKERSGIRPNRELINACVQLSSENLDGILEDLVNWSLITERNFSDSFVLYAGSDFNVAQEIEDAIAQLEDIDPSAITRMSGLQPVLAKRHYHETGALRWFDQIPLPASEAVDFAQSYKPSGATCGAFVVLLPTEGESETDLKRIQGDVLKAAGQFDIVPGVVPRADLLLDRLKEAQALELLRERHPALLTDKVAEKEVEERLTGAQLSLRNLFEGVFDEIKWRYSTRKSEAPAQRSELSELASILAAKRFKQSPTIKNELLNRVRPSASAVAAQNSLLKAMVSQAGRERLGFDGYPAEAGLFHSIILEGGLYQQVADGSWSFSEPGKEGALDKLNLAPIWSAADEFLEQKSDGLVELTEIYDCWAKPPYGLKSGLIPLMFVTYLMTRSDRLAFYRDTVFQVSITDVDIEVLTSDPRQIHVRKLSIDDSSKELMAALSSLVKYHGGPDEALDVGRALVGLFDNLPSWTKRTANLSDETKKVREALKRARDPHKFIFDDLPTALGAKPGELEPASIKDLATKVEDGLSELGSAYDGLIDNIRMLLFAELKVKGSQIAELNARASNMQKLTGDFQLEAFISRLTVYSDENSQLEGLVSLAASKPPKDWTDADIDRAKLKLVELSRKFIKSETYGRVRGRKAKRHAIGLIFNDGTQKEPFVGEFNISENEKHQAEALAISIDDWCGQQFDADKPIILAALAKLSEKYASDLLADEQLELI